jgi:hypothetical protein
LDVLLFESKKSHNSQVLLHTYVEWCLCASEDGFSPGFSDGIFSNQKSQSGYILEGLGTENVGIFYGRLE